MSEQSNDEPLVDTADFVGKPPAGDAYLDDFVSNDQSRTDEPVTDESADSGQEDE